MSPRNSSTSPIVATFLLAAAAAAGDPGITPSHVHLPVWQPDSLGDFALFGHDVAIEGHHAAVAANEPDMVVTYEQIGGLWTEGQVLTGAVDDADDFGSAVDLHGERLFVGAYSDDTLGPDTGAVHVFERSDGAWTLVQTLHADAPSPGSFFGASVVADGEWLGVGATQDEPSGSIHVFRDEGQGYELVDVLTNGFVELFGHRFTLRARPGGATVDVIAGDTWSDVITEDGGAVWPFVVTPGNTILYGPLFPSDLDAGDRFGRGVAFDGEQLFVSSPWDDDVASDAGAVYVFDIDWDGVVPTFHEVAKLTPPSGETYELYGYRLAVADNRLAVSGRISIGAQEPNYVDVYRPAIFGSGWDHDDRLFGVEWEQGEAFGHALAIDAGRVLVGAHNKKGQGVARGAAYMFSTAPKFEIAGHSPSPYLTQKETYGEGKAGTLGVPVMSSKTPAVPGQTLVVGVSNLIEGSTPVLFWGAQRAALPFDGGMLLVANPTVVMLSTVGAFGQVGIGGTVPDDLALCGLEIHMQAMFVDPGADGPHQTAQTNGLTLTVGY